MSGLRCWATHVAGEAGTPVGQRSAQKGVGLAASGPHPDKPACPKTCLTQPVTPFLNPPQVPSLLRQTPPPLLPAQLAPPPRQQWSSFPLRPPSSLLGSPLPLPSPLPSPLAAPRSRLWSPLHVCRQLPLAVLEQSVISFHPSDHAGMTQLLRPHPPPPFTHSLVHCT